MIQASHDLGKIERTLGNNNREKANRLAAEKFLQRAQPYVPMKSGALRSLGQVIDHETVEWRGVPYGKAQFFGTNGMAVFKNYTTPGTGKRWDLVTKGNHMQEIEQAYVRGLLK